MPTNMKIDIKKKYRTEGRRAIIVHAVDGPRLGRPVVVSREDKDGCWHLDSYPADGKDADGMSTFDLIEIQPEPPLVQLGPNVNRGGEEVRVICIDLASDRFPVICVTKDGRIDGTSATGSYLNNDTPHDRDLIGHMPPAVTREPREWWVNEYDNTLGTPRNTKEEALGVGGKPIAVIRVREVIEEVAP